MGANTLNLSAIHAYEFLAKEQIADWQTPQAFLDLQEAIYEIKKQLKQVSLCKFNPKELINLNDKINGLYRLSKRLYRYSDRRHSKFLKMLYWKAICLKLGGKIDVSTFCEKKLDDFLGFITQNHLHHKFQSLRLQLEVDEEGDPILPIIDSDGKIHQIEWSSLIKYPKYNEKGICNGYTFHYYGQAQFETDKNLRLTDDYILTYQGITPYNPYKSKGLIVYDRQDPREWNYGYILEVWTMLKDLKGRGPTIGVGDHCHLILKDNHGNVYSIGKFSESADLTFWGYFSLFGKKRGRLMCPDTCVYLAQDMRDFDKVSIPLTKSQYKEIFRILSNERESMTPVFSLLKNNCSSYIQQLIVKVLDIRVDSRIFLPKYLIRACLSSKIQMRIFESSTKLIDKMPKWMKKSFYFIPPIYIPTMIAAIFMKLFGLRNKQGFQGSDVSFKDVFFKPWNVYIDHPIAVRESLRQVSQNKKPDDKK